MAGVKSPAGATNSSVRLSAGLLTSQRLPPDVGPSDGCS